MLCLNNNAIILYFYKLIYCIYMGSCGSAIVDKAIVKDGEQNLG